MTDITCPVCGEVMDEAYTDDGDYGRVCLNDDCPLDCCTFTMEEISKPRPLETALRARIAELEGLLSKQAESDNKRIAELEAENAALKAENAQHDWWGGGGR